jgi:hypothetical protein
MGLLPARVAGADCSVIIRVPLLHVEAVRKKKKSDLSNFPGFTLLNIPSSPQGLNDLLTYCCTEYTNEYV